MRRQYVCYQIWLIYLHKVIINQSNVKAHAQNS